jgi:hypothetical protein
MRLGSAAWLVGDDDGTEHLSALAEYDIRPRMLKASRLEAPGAPPAGSIARGLDRLRRWGRGMPSGPDAGLTPSADTSNMLVVAALQHADGSWDLTRELARAIGHDLAELELIVSGAEGQRDEARRAWATALALAWLEAHAPEAEAEWRLLAAKARKWLDGVTARPADGGSWRDLSARLLAARAG